MCKCGCMGRKGMLESSLEMYQDALTDLEKEVLALDERELLFPNVRRKWEENADLMAFYDKEIYKIKQELKVCKCEKCTE